MPLAAPLADLLPPVMPERFSVSFISGAGECMLMARMQREANTDNEFSIIGSAAHEVFSTCELLAQFQGMTQLYPDTVEEIAERVLSNPEEERKLPLVVYAEVRKQARLWAERVVLPADADRWVIEHPFRQPLVDPVTGHTYIISGRMDEVAIWGTHYRNRDWKTGPGLPKQADVEERHVQLPAYAWAAWREWPWLETFECEEFYTRYGVPRTVNLTLGDLAAVEDYLLAACRRIHKAYRDNHFPPTPDERWCNSRCPNPGRCPLPEQVRAGQAVHVHTRDEALAQIEAWLVEEARVKRRKAGVQAFLEGHHEEFLPVGRKGHGYFAVKSRRLAKDKVAAALAEHGLDLDDFYDEETGTEFTSRVL